MLFNLLMKTQLLLIISFVVCLACKPKYALFRQKNVINTFSKDTVKEEVQKTIIYATVTKTPQQKDILENKIKKVVVVKKIKKYPQTIKPQKNISKTKGKKIKKKLKIEKKQLQTHIQSQGGQGSLIVLSAILALFLPPVAVIFFEGKVTKKFWWNLLFTILGFFPGVVHALLVIFEVI